MREQKKSSRGLEHKAYCFKADAKAMAEIDQEGVVEVDEAKDIQEFIAEEVMVDKDTVGIIHSDEGI